MSFDPNQKSNAQKNEKKNFLKYDQKFGSEKKM